MGLPVVEPIGKLPLVQAQKIAQPLPPRPCDAAVVIASLRTWVMVHCAIFGPSEQAMMSAPGAFWFSNEGLAA